MEELKSIAKEFERTGKLISYECRTIGYMTLEQKLYLYANELYLVNLVCDKVISIILK